MNTQANTRPQADYDSLPIRNDRDLLRVLQMSDTQAAMFLGRTRQTLINHLGPRKGGDAPPSSTYFKVRDIVSLLSAARQLGRTFDATAIEKYVADTRPRKEGDREEAHEMLERLLGGPPEELSADRATALVLSLPAFAEMRTWRPEIAKRLRKRMAAIKAEENAPEIIILSSTALQANAACKWLGIDTPYCYGRDVVEYFLPSILAYNSNNDEVRPFVLTEKGSFVSAPRFMSQMIVDCFRSLLPEEASEMLTPAVARG